MKSTRDRPKKPDIIYKDKKYWMGDVTRTRIYSHEYDNPINCDGFTMYYWESNEEVSEDDELWQDEYWWWMLAKKADNLFGVYNEID